jgi:hypothetical protein
VKNNILVIITFYLFISAKFILVQGIIKDDFRVNDDTTIANIEHKYSSVTLNAVGDFIIV